MPPEVKGSMIYRPLGACGAKVSAFGLGGWLTYGGSIKDANAVRAIARGAFDAGVNFFDIADVYARGEAERVMGQSLAELPRHELVISSKVFFPMSDDVNDRGLSRKHVFESVHKSLRRIGTDYLDLYFCHRFDEATPLEETARAMDDLVHQGKVLYWGTSEWTGGQLRDVHGLCNRLGLYRPQVEQPQYSLLARAKFEGDTRPAALEQGMGLVVWSPLGSGLLTGKYDQGMPRGSRLAQQDWLRENRYTEANVDKVKRLKPIAESVGCSRAQLALAWTAAQPGVSSVILGASSVEQLKENLGAVKVELTEALRSRLDALFPTEKGG